MRRGTRAAAWAALAATLAAPLPVRADGPAAPPERYPRCTAGQMGAFGWTHPAFGHQIPGIALRNVSLRTCRVAGFPDVHAYQADGRAAGVRVARAFFLDDRAYPYAIVPGDAAFFALYGDPPHGEFDRTCVGITRVEVRLPSAGAWIGVDVSSGTCGGRLRISQLFPAGELAASAARW